MGKLHDDMMFLDKIVNHPALQKNILILKEENQKSPTKDIDKVKNFWRVRKLLFCSTFRSTFIFTLRVSIKYQRVSYLNKSGSSLQNDKKSL